MAKRQRRKRRERRREHAKREGWSTRHSVITGAAITAGAVLGTAQPALADSFTVNSTLDNGDGTCQDVVTGDCTLRDAIYDANANSNYSNIFFASSVTGTITLGSSIGIHYPTYIYGPGPSSLTISGGNTNGIFYTNMVNTGDYFDVNGLTLADGSQFAGGAIYDANATLDVFNSVLTGNSAYAGGAIFELGNGGTPYTIYSTVKDNTAVLGGGIFGYGFGLLGATTFNNNTAYNVGGAVVVPPVALLGGRIYDSTLAGNHAGNYTGGVYSPYAYSTNSILANNSGGDVQSHYFFPAFSLVRDPGTTSVSGPSNITGQDPQLAGPANNGGTTPTMKPAAGSPVVDQGNSTGGPAGKDQRGIGRPVDNPNVSNAAGGNGADIGSVELTLAEGPQPPVPPPPPPVVHKKKKCKKKKKHRSAESAKKKKCKKKKKRSVAAPASAASARAFFSAEIRDGHRIRRATRSGDRQFGNGTQRPAGFDWADHAWRNGR